MNAGSRLGVLGALGITVSMLVAACGAAPVSPSPSAAGTPAESVAVPTPTGVMSPTASARPAPTATPAPSASVEGTSTARRGPWVPTRSLAGWVPSSIGAAVPLRDGGALAIGEWGMAAQRWDPATATWQEVAGLNATRRAFAAVQLRDGRVLVTGGLDTHDNDRWQAYSSTYVYDPTTPAGTWTKVGLLGTARVAPAAALLPDGRVLVAGGAYKDGPPYEDAGSSGITLAASRSIVPGPGTGEGRRFDDMAPPDIGVALATAELFDPSTGRWSPTGSMRFARAGAVAATLSDGRVLVVGPGTSDIGAGWAEMDPRVFGTAELYDPATGRFSLVGSLPPIDRAEIAAAGVDLQEDPSWIDDPSWASEGTLVTLPDGGALLVGQSDEWKHMGYVTRTFRFDARSGRWRQVGKASVGFYSSDRETWLQTPGVDLAGAFAAVLPDGRVLVAGGTTGGATGESEMSRVARLYDPVTNTWSRVPSMPKGRSGGVTVALADGSILLIGGNETTPGGSAANAVRFVPSP